MKGLNEKSYVEAKLVCDKIAIRQSKSKRNTKPGWEIMKARETARTSEINMEGKIQQDILE